MIMRPFLFLCALLCLGGCERKITEANLKAVKPDMTTKEVESILGAPNRIETAPELVSQEVKTIPVTRYVYVQDGKNVELLFFGDRLGTNAVKGNFPK
jgi:lauroyl/myristoyl acyltransferase